MAIFACPVFFGPHSLAMLVTTWRAMRYRYNHDTIRINYKKGATTENHGAGVKYMAKGCMFDDCVCVI